MSQKTFLKLLVFFHFHCIMNFSVVCWTGNDWSKKFNYLPGTHPPHRCPAKMAYVLAYFSLLFGKGVCPWNTNLRTTDRCTISIKTSVPQWHQSTIGGWCWLIFELIKLFVDIVYWCWCCTLFRINTSE